MPCDVHAIKLRMFTWDEFDEAVANTERPVGHNLYPIARGGYIYAVALSHKYGIRIAEKPDKMSVVIDDVADSGKTLTALRFRHGNLPAYVLFKKDTTFGKGIHAAHILGQDEWVVFPWENKEKALDDFKQYMARS